MNYRVYVALSNYLQKLGRAEAKGIKPGKYSPSEYHRELIRLLGKNDEHGFKRLKLEQGYASALGY